MTSDPLERRDRPVGPTTGWGVLHLFCKPRPGAEARSLLDAIDDATKEDCQVVTASMLGHKADICVLALGPDMRRLRRLQTHLQTGGLDVVDSYVSLTEVSEYAAGVPEELKQARLYPTLPPEGMAAMCFYPMSKRRAPGAENWYTLGFDERMELMRGHGTAGRAIPRPRPAARDRVNRARRLGVGRDPVRRTSGRPEGVRLCHALRPGIDPLRRVRPVLHRNRRGGRGRSRRRRRTLRRWPPAILRTPESGRRSGRLEAALGRLGPLVVAFSGGADSALVAAVATRHARSRPGAVRDRGLGVARVPRTGTTAPRSRPSGDSRWVAVATHELDDPAYVRNDLDRCYHCKRELMDVLAPLATSEQATVVLGVNLDDLDDHRPGQRAAAERGAVFPLVQAGLDKATVRAVSRAIGLRTWDRPAAACLASRVPHGTPVSFGILGPGRRGGVLLAAARLRRPAGPPLR